jgi:HSP20 family protein
MILFLLRRYTMVLTLSKNPNMLTREKDLFSSFADDLFSFHEFPHLKKINNTKFLPALDFVEKEKEYTVNMEIPGMDTKDIEVEIENNKLIVKGEKKSEIKEETDEGHVCERQYGAFRREIVLPENCNEGKIDAIYKNGVLSLKLPKIKPKEKDKKKKIPIKS